MSQVPPDAAGDPDFSYDSVAERYARMVDSAPYNAFYDRPAMLAIVDRLGVRARRVLDAGCGTGWYTQQLLERGALVTGIDASKGMLAFARARLEREQETNRDSGAQPMLAAVNLSEGLPFPSEHFDFAIAPLVLHYIRDWSPTLVELRRVLVPGGRFLFSTHHPGTEAQRLTDDGFDVRYDEIQLVEEEWTHIGRVRFYRRSLNRIFDAVVDAGFTIERLIEPVPTQEFREVKPDAYEKLLRRPEFLIVQARR
jgi:SAM-dependent methyltransferase